MKKLLLILCLVPNLAFASYSDQMRSDLKDFCMYMIAEGKDTSNKELMKEFSKTCDNISNCVVNNAPHEIMLTQEDFLQQQLLNCLYKEHQKAQAEYKKQ